MKENLFYGGELTPDNKKDNNSFYWVTTRLVRESGPWITEVMHSPEDIQRIMRDHLDLENCDREHFIVIYLDRKFKVNAINVLSIGGLHSSIVHPREVFKTALLTSSASVILCHNHPSGDPAPSREDVEVTRRLVNAGDILGIEVMDHIIVGDQTYVSFKAKGLI